MTDHKVRGEQLCREASALAVRAGLPFADLEGRLREVVKAVENVLEENWWDYTRTDRASAVTDFSRRLARCAEATAAVMRLADAHLPDLPHQPPETATDPTWQELAERVEALKPSAVRPTADNPYLTLKQVIHDVFLLAADACQGKAVFDRINPATDPWDRAERLARSRSADWGIPFQAFDGALIAAKEVMRELVQVAAGNNTVRFSLFDPRFSQIEERLQQLADSVPTAAKAIAAAVGDAGEREQADGTVQVAGQTPGAGGMTSGSAGSDSEPALSDLQYDILATLFRLKATTSDQRQSSEIIASKLSAKTSPTVVKEAAKPLVGRYLGSKSGPGGGYWLTEAGRQLIERVQNR
jgi:hypothetical protein